MERFFSISQKVYSAIDSIIRFENHGIESYTEKLKIMSLLHKDKISCIHMLWRSDLFKDIDILIDVVVCFKNEKIVKALRNCTDLSLDRIKDSHHSKEHQLMRSLPVHTRNGFILAKAVRIASIAQPYNIESFGLEEAVNVDDVITSFILKAHVFHEEIFKSDFDKYITPQDVAVAVYEHVKTNLDKKQISASYASYIKEYPVDCTECDHEYGCCKQRKLMLAMVDKILEWLKEHKNELLDIDFSDDVDLIDVIDEGSNSSSSSSDDFDWLKSDI